MKTVVLFISMSLDGYISVIPTIFASGIRLFETILHEFELLLVGINTYNGITYPRYICR